MKLSDPKKSSLGVYVTTPSANVTVPFDGSVTVNVNVSPSTSLERVLKSNVPAVSSVVAILPAEAVGASLTAVTVTLTVPVAVAVPSLTV